jgi:DNA-binding CsgD family transcriptional regulator
MSTEVWFQDLPEQRSCLADSSAVLIDFRGVPVSPTSDALRVLLYPREIPPNGKAVRLASQRLHELFPAGPLAEETAPEGEFLSGRRRYLYRIYRFGDLLPKRHAPAAVIVLERLRPPLAPTPARLAPYRLTGREEQVLRLVMTGLSNKQIAERIGISPNTVKVFLRLIMTKMEVTSRFGILGKVLGRTEGSRQAAPGRAGAAVAELSRAGNV